MNFSRLKPISGVYLTLKPIFFDGKSPLLSTSRGLFVAGGEARERKVRCGFCFDAERKARWTISGAKCGRERKEGRARASKSVRRGLAAQ